MENLELHESVLTAELNAGLAGQPIADTVVGPAFLREITVSLRNGEMTIVGTAQAAFITLPVEVVAGVDARGGRAAVDIQTATVAGIPIPEATRQQIANSIQERVDEETAGQHVRSITISNGRLLIVSTRS